MDGIAVSRWTVPTSGSTLVRLRLTNEREERVVVRVIEAVPDEATSTIPMTTTGDRIDNWQRVGGRIVHEFTLPVGEKRTSAYLIRSEDEPPLSLEPPTVDAIEPVDETARVDAGTVLEPVDSTDGGVASNRNEVGQPPRESPSTGTVPAGSLPEQAPDDDGSEGDPDLSEPVERSVSDDSEMPDRDRSSDEPSGEEPESIVDRLIEALAEDATSEQRRTLRSELGASESERARLDHVRSRLEDLDAYIDALEELIDTHGVDVVDEMRDAIDENASATASLETEIRSIEGEIDRHREETTESLESIESEMTAIWSGLSDRLDSLESELDATRSALSDLQDDVDTDRQTRAREVRRFDQSISEIQETLEGLAENVEEHDAFRRRFTAAFTSGSQALQDDDESGESGESDAFTDGD